MASSANQPRRVLVSPEDLIDYEIDGKYRLDSIIGGGGMGMVYRTTQQNLNRPVALKLLKLNEGDSKKSLERFKREIDIVSQLTHPNIVRVFDSGIDPELRLHYIVMELVDGVGLDKLVASWKFEPELSLEIARGICAALTEPHHLGIVHRDIKPGNVLLTVRSDDTLGVKVVDFGISRSTQVEEDGRVTATGEVVGSPLYMAPEAARAVDIDGRTDLYSLGVLLYEMVSGQPLFQGPTPVSIMLRHLGERPPSLDELMPVESIPAALSTLVDSLLAKAPDERPDSAREVLQRLDEIRDAHGLRALRLDGRAAAIDALRPWLRRLEAPTGESSGEQDTTDLWRPDETTDSLPYFEGWLVPDSAELVRQTSPLPGAEFDTGDGMDAVEYSRTQQLDTQGELVAENVDAENVAADAAAHRPKADVSTGSIARGPGVEETGDLGEAESAGKTRTWLVAGVLVALLATGGVLLWMIGEGDENDAGAQDIEAPRGVVDPPATLDEAAAPSDEDAEPSKNIAPAGQQSVDPANQAPEQDSPKVGATREAVDDDDPPTSGSSTTNAGSKIGPARDSRPKKREAGESTRRVDKKEPADQNEQVDQEEPAEQKTPAVKKASEVKKTGADEEKLDEGLEWLRSR